MSAAKIVKAAHSSAVPYALTAEQRRFNQAQQVVKSRLADIAKALQIELGRLLTDVAFDIDVQLASGVGLENYLAEPGVLTLDSSLPLDEERACFMTIDHQAVHNMADLCLGGQLTDKNQIEAKPEFSSSETRICCRLLQKQAQALLQLFCNCRQALTAHLYKQQLPLSAFAYLPLKVRLLLAQDAVSWFLWLPAALFLPDVEESPLPEAGLLLSAQDWQHIPLRGRVEMARKQVRLAQLQRWVAGDMLPIDLNEPMDFRLGDQLLFQGAVAEEGTQLMFQISHKQEK